MQVIDAHLHVWGTGDDGVPFAEGRQPTARADTDFLLKCMDAADVAGSLIIQPIVYGFDHRYVTAALRAHPDRFRGMCLVDPRHDDPVGELRRWRDEGYGSVRFNPGLFPADRGLDSDLGHELFRAAGELGMPVGFLISPEHFAAVDALCTAAPETVAVVDHFGHCRPTDGPNPDFDELLALARHARLHVKLSEFPRASLAEWPYFDLHRWTPERLMWATDFPFIVEQCGYTEGLTLLTQETPGIDEPTMQQLVAGTAETVFGRWGS